MKSVFFAFLMVILLIDAVSAETGGLIAVANIPIPAQCYFDAITKKDVNALGECFQAEAEIIDVNRKIAGIGAIRNWASDEVFGGRYEILEIVSQKKNLIKLLIRFVPPGLWGKLSKGFSAHYTFEFSNGKIIKMDPQYA
jgi:hypothetical protein